MREGGQPYCQHLRGPRDPAQVFANGIVEVGVSDAGSHGHASRVVLEGAEGLDETDTRVIIGGSNDDVDVERLGKLGKWSRQILRSSSNKRVVSAWNHMTVTRLSHTLSHSLSQAPL